MPQMTREELLQRKGGFIISSQESQEGETTTLKEEFVPSPRNWDHRQGFALHCGLSRERKSTAALVFSPESSGESPSPS